MPTDGVVQRLQEPDLDTMFVGASRAKHSHLERCLKAGLLGLDHWGKLPRRCAGSTREKKRMLEGVAARVVQIEYKRFSTLREDDRPSTSWKNGERTVAPGSNGDLAHPG